MAIEYRSGDLFAQSDVDAFAHGVNCKGVIGGIASIFFSSRKKYKKRYVEDCNNGKYKEGNCYPYRISSKNDAMENATWLYNLTSQKYPGANAKPVWLRSALREMFEHATKNDVSRVAVPMIGAGIGGLTEDCVRTIFEEESATTDVLLVVISQSRAAPVKGF